MTHYTDLYIASASLDALQSFLAEYPVHIPIQKGRLAQAAMIDPATGEGVDGIAAAGDPALFYSCVRSPTDISQYVQEPLMIVDASSGIDLLGIFSD